MTTNRAPLAGSFAARRSTLITSCPRDSSSRTTYARSARSRPSPRYAWRAIVLSRTAASNIAAPVRSALRSTAAPAVLSALLALVLYAVTLPGTYVYDDLYIVQRDPRIADVRLWPKFWTKDYFN